MQQPIEVEAGPGLGPRRHRRDRHGHDGLRLPPAAVLLGQGLPAHRGVRPQKRPGQNSKGNPYLKAALAQMATGAVKTDTFLGERYRRLIKRMPKVKALVALQRSILIIIFHLLADPTTGFTDLGPDFYTRRINLARRTSQLTCQLQALGYTVEITSPKPPKTPPQPTPPPGHHLVVPSLISARQIKQVEPVVPFARPRLCFRSESTDSRNIF
jgi:hypothetical protein